MTWVIIAFAVAAVIIVARVYFQIKKIRGGSKQESWDAKIIEQLRAKGYAPFNEYKVDFFLALPDEAACQRVQTRLESDGFAVDAKAATENSDLPFSLHASKMMRLIVPDMQALSQKLGALAEEFGGRYDGWTA